MTEKEKYDQCHKEAKITLRVYAGYMVWWFLMGFGLNSLGVNKLPFIMNLPMWFFMSCIVGWILVTIVVILVTRKHFKHFDLGQESDSPVQK